MRALILDPGAGRSALAGCRALGRARWTVGIGAPADTISARSRWAAAFYRLPAIGESAEGYAEAVGRAVWDGGYDVVVPAGDAEAFAVSEFRDAVGCCVPYADHAVVADSFDKQRLAELCADAGVPAPETTSAGSVGADDLPVVVKARTHALGRHEATVVRTMAEFDQAVGELVSAGIEPVVQEVVSGTLTAVSVVCDPHSQVVARVQQRALAVWPVPAGVSTRAETIPVDGELFGGVERLVKALGWFGLAELQFLEPAEGEPRLIDCNGRLYGSLSLATAAGVNLPDAWCALAVGATPATGEPRVGTRYQWLEGDLRRAMGRRQWREVADTVAFALRAEHSILSREDPRPAVSQMGRLAVRAVKKAVKAATSRP